MQLSDIRRTDVKKWIDRLNEEPKLFLVRPEPFGVSGREFPDVGHVLVVVHSKGQRGWTSGGLKFRQQRSVRARVSEVDLEAVALEFEVVEDPRPQEAEEVGGPRELVARNDLFGDSGTADDVASLENASPGESWYSVLVVGSTSYVGRAGRTV